MSLLLRHTPGEWDGTFTLLVQALAKDLLHEGPIEVLINNEVRLRTLTGWDTTAGYLIFAGDETVDVSEIDEIEVA